MSTVLIIDDDEVDFLIHSKIIKKGGFAETIIYQNSGVVALEYLKRILDRPGEWPSHIFVDINMPPITGFEFLDAYMNFPEELTKKAKIYILSSSDSLDDKSKASEFSVITEYIVKPLSIEKAHRIFSQG